VLAQNVKIKHHKQKNSTSNKQFHVLGKSLFIINQTQKINLTSKPLKEKQNEK
jgi:hypothetical protein